MSATSPAPSYWGPPLPYAAAPPPLPVRAAIVLLWVKLAVGALASILLVAVPGLRDQALDPAGAIPVGFVVGVIVLAVVFGVLVPAAVAVVLTVFLGRGHRWVRVVVLVLAGLSVLWLAVELAQVVVGVLGDPDVLASAAPLLVSFTSDVVITALWVAIVVLLFLPASRWWLSERTAQRQSDRRLPRGPAERW